MRVICEYQSYAEPPLKQIASAVLERHERPARDAA